MYTIQYIQTVNIRKPNIRFSALLKVVRLLNCSDFERRSITELNRSVIGRSVGYSRPNRMFGLFFSAKLDHFSYIFF